jgi:hypothetical protein
MRLPVLECFGLIDPCGTATVGAARKLRVVAGPSSTATAIRGPCGCSVDRVRSVITEFVWSYQSHFRQAVQYDIDDALLQIGLDADPLVILVAVSDIKDVTHPVCVEPETGAIKSVDFGSIGTLAAQIFARDPESEIVHTNRALHETRQRGLFQQSRGEAIRQSIDESGKYSERTVIVGPPGRQSGFNVYTVVMLDKGTFEQLPAFDDEVVDRVYVGRSLQHEVVAECLRRAAAAVQAPDAGMSLSVLGSSHGDLVRAAGRRFLNGLTFRATGEPADLYERMCRITELAYERSQAAGHIVVMGSEPKQLDIELTEAVRLSTPRSARKLLETCRGGLRIVSDGRGLLGLSRAPSAATDEDAQLEIVISGTAEWEARWGSRSYVQVSFGRPALPTSPISPEAFADTLNRRLAGCDIETLWRLVNEAQQFGHGTTVVIVEGAQAEASRLGAQGHPIRPQLLSRSELESVAAVDGAILVDPEGRCHAFGIILDGQADGEGDPARGSRYNSALRYCRSSAYSCAAVIVSDDGTVDLVPKLRRQIERRRIDDALEAFESTIENDHDDGEPYARARREIERLAFYLSADQCDRANRVEQAIWNGRAERGGIRLHQQPFQPDPELDDSYFLPEETA